MTVRTVKQWCAVVPCMCTDNIKTDIHPLPDESKLHVADLSKGTHLFHGGRTLGFVIRTHTVHTAHHLFQR